MSGVIFVYSSCQCFHGITHSLLIEQNISVYEYCMTGDSGGMQNVTHNFFSIRHEPSKKTKDRGIASLLAEYSLSSVLYIGDDCK